jgi:alanyl-tRNA synthetase
MKTNEIRKKWIEYFTEKCPKSHKLYPSASLVPDNPTLLLNSAGMVQFVPVFLGTKKAPEPPRATTIQKCVRVGGKDSDLENIGRTSRHHSFFEMLGNFSFGDYFKSEVIPWAWQFLTLELGLNPEKLYISVFEGDAENDFDSEAYEIWYRVLSSTYKDLGLEFKAEDRIWKLPRKHNFWGPPGPSGPCGPCSEIYYDRGEKYNAVNFKPEAHLADQHEDRFIEIWNLVFMEFLKDDEGKFSPLENKNIDTGAGLERLAMILQDKPNSFETDELSFLRRALIEALKIENPRFKDFEELSSEEQTHIKIIVDHLRCLAFLIADGVRPSNLGRGYVLRMIIRRAARFLYLLRNENDAFLYKILYTVIETYSGFYPELQASSKIIFEITKKEEEQFSRTIQNGINLLKEKLKNPSKEKLLDGDFLFDLYSTYGFPIELSKDIAKEQNIRIDEEGYELARERHSQVSNTGAFKVSLLQEKSLPLILERFGRTDFIGYDENESISRFQCLVDDGANFVELLTKKALEGYSEIIHGYPERESDKKPKISIVLDKTPFYAESGGQLGDTGFIEVLKSRDSSKANFRFKIMDTKAIEGIYFHQIDLEHLKEELKEVPNDFFIKSGDELKASIDPERRSMTKKHHSACHLLQAALRKFLGPQIQQAGSQVGPEYTRFDFNFERSLKSDELFAVEKQVNEWILADLDVKTELKNYEDAIASGALAFFEEKYENDVRVLSMGTALDLASVELCGGTHVSKTSEIEKFKIVSESSVAAGLRRIRALCGNLVDKYLEEEKLKTETALREEEERAALKEIQKNRLKELENLALEKSEEILRQAQALANDSLGLILNINEFFPEGLESEILKALAENLKNKIENSGKQAFILLGTSVDSQVIFLSLVSKNLSKEPDFNAGKIVKEAAQICSGNGGGRPDFAQAGGKDSSKLGLAIEKLREELLRITING